MVVFYINTSYICEKKTHMDQFKHIFNATSIYDTMFFTVKTAIEYKNIDQFEEKNPQLYNIWSHISQKRFGALDDNTYLTRAGNMPEFSKITSITLGGYRPDKERLYTLTIDDGNEVELLKKFFDILNSFQQKKLDGFLFGHNISKFDIPFLIKRGLRNNLKIPKILKSNLMAKPWENGILDSLDLWKFTGNEYMPFILIAEFLNLKYDELPDNETFSHIYWNAGTEDEAKKWIRIKSQAYIYTLIELYNKLREM